MYSPKRVLFPKSRHVYKILERKTYSDGKIVYSSQYYHFDWTKGAVMQCDPNLTRMMKRRIRAVHDYLDYGFFHTYVSKETAEEYLRLGEKWVGLENGLHVVCETILCLFRIPITATVYKGHTIGGVTTLASNKLEFVDIVEDPWKI